MLCLGVDKGYASEQGKLVSMDIVRGEWDSTAFLCTLSTTFGVSSHSVSIPSFTDGGTWADDSNYVGVQCFAADGILSLSFHKDNELTSTIKFNDVAITVQNSELYANCVDTTKGYLSLGLINNAGPTMKYIIRDFGDNESDVYFTEDGAFGKTKSELSEIKVLDTTGFSVDQVLALKERYDAIPYSSLYSYDQAWLKADYNAVTEKVNKLVADAGVEITVSVYEKKVDEFVKKCDSLSTISLVNEALEAYNAALEAKSDINESELNNSQKTRIDSAFNSFNGCDSKLKTAMKTVYEEAVDAYEKSVDNNIASSDDYLNSKNSKLNIPTSFNEYLEEEFVSSVTTRIETADSKLTEKTTLKNDNWIQGKNAHVITKDGGMDVVTAGDTLVAPEDNNGVFSKQALNVLDFDVVLNFSSFGGGEAGSWITFGLMEKPEQWVLATNDSIQDNKGVFFLVKKINSQLADVQCFVCSMVCNTFYDSVWSQNIQVPIGQDMKVSFTSVEKTIAGVTDSYYQIKFGDVQFDEIQYKTRTLKTVFGTGLKGYFFASSGYIPKNNPAVIKIGQINGKDPFSADLSKEEVSVDLTPTSTSKEASYKAGSTDVVSFNLDTKDKAISAVKVGGKTISSGDYSYSNNTLTLSNDYLTTLAEGNYTVEVVTTGGTCSWTLNVTKGSTGGCGSSIIASASIVSLVSLLGICFLISKKRSKQF